MYLYSKLFIFLLVISSLSAAKKELQKKHIALSLNQLQKQVESYISSNQPVVDSVKKLGTLNKPYGFVLDSDHNDIIIFGESFLPNELLYVDDIAAAVRNIFFSDTFPQCYIKMRDVELDDYQHLMEGLKSRDIANEKATIQWKQKKRSRDIYIKELPNNCHFSQILVNADCILKKFLHGDHRIRVRGLKSYIEVYKHACLKELESNNPINEAFWHEFWLFPDNTKIFHNTSTYYFYTPMLKLYTEEELLYDYTSYYAKQAKIEFVKLFNERYVKIKEKEPVFAAVEAIYSLLLIFDQIKRNEFQKEKVFSPQFWSERYTIEPLSVENEIPTIYNALYIDAEFGKTYSTRASIDFTILYANLCIAGGIMLDYEKNVTLVKGKSDTLKQLRESIISSRPSKQSVFWEFTR